MNKTVYLSGSITDPATGQPRDGWQKDFLEAEAKLSLKASTTSRAMSTGLIT